MNDAWKRAARHRDALPHVPFVAITGSCGKTTTKTLVEGVLGGVVRGTTSPGSGNCGDDLIANVRRARADDAFCLQEMGAWGPGTLDAGLALVRPSIGVVLNVRRDHFSAFHGLEGTAAEKAKVVTGLPSAGTAILNADDDLVLGMRSGTEARTLTFGRSPVADLRATDVSARWPDRLSFRLTFRGESYQIDSRLLGEQSLGSVLAAIAVVSALGQPVELAVRRLRRVEPPSRRMSPVVTPDGVTFIRDDFKAPSDSLGEALQFLAQARAARTVAVIGRISDYSGRSRPTYTRFARAAVDVVDELVFVGVRAAELWGHGPGIAGERARVGVFETVEAAAAYLRRSLRPGDLVLLKGSGPADHLERILHDREVPVSCWLPACGRVTSCDDCRLLHAEPVRVGVR